MAPLDEPLHREVREDGEVLSFEEKQKAHFLTRLQEKWQCDVQGHGVCVPTEDGQHFKLSDLDVADWVEALCLGCATTSQPPNSVLESANNGALWNRADGTCVLRAVSIAPARSRGASVRTSTSSVPSSPSIASSGVLGPGYLAGKAFKWVGERSLLVMEDFAIATRTIQHRSRLRSWEKGKNSRIVHEERAKLFEMLGHALHMSLPCYPDHINKGAYAIGRDLQRYLHSFPEILETKESAEWFCRIQICLVPLLLARISHFDALAGDLAWELLDTLTKVPLACHGPDTTSEVVHIIASELAYSKCTSQHSWLGLDLLRIVETELRTRPLTGKEMGVIRDMAIRRQAQRQIDRQEEFSRPWEVALFAQCASQDPWFKDIVLGPRGLDSLVHTLCGMLSDRVPTEDVPWESVALTLRTLAFLSEHEWIAKHVKPQIIASLLRVYRRNIPKRWFCTRFWAMDTIRNMVSHRPALCRILKEQGAIDAIATLMTVPQSRDKATSRMYGDYKKEATKRAEELSKYLNKWTSEWTPDSLPKLELVSMSRMFWLEE